MRLYTEEEIRDAWQRAYLMVCYPGDFHSKFLVALRAGKEVKPMLFTKQELLAAPATGPEKVMIHGIFAMLGTDVANEAALMSHAREANLGGNMAIVIGLAKAKKDENFQPGDVVRDADKNSWLKRPLEKMPLWTTPPRT